MKIFISNLNESWIIDRMQEEFANYNPDIVTNNIKESDIIWIIAPWMWRKIPKKYLKSKTVVCSVHHLEEKDYSGKPLKEFYKRDKYVDFYHTISEKSKIEIQKLTLKMQYYQKPQGHRKLQLNGGQPFYTPDLKGMKNKKIYDKFSKQWKRKSKKFQIETSMRFRKYHKEARSIELDNNSPDLRTLYG